MDIYSFFNKNFSLLFAEFCQLYYYNIIDKCDTLNECVIQHTRISGKKILVISMYHTEINKQTIVEHFQHLYLEHKFYFYSISQYQTTYILYQPQSGVQLINKICVASVDTFALRYVLPF